ncbi:conserved hypothetical protein [Microscilla marina ATCC 23134]|uniref:DUF3052 domain-containing protein n=2 Tax=Microscilla marina TaxID=1027 RepID=A1ZXD1_MICM2|nr:conserved hypothetical protein [Microscilla marina ATCC 23134]
MMTMTNQGYSGTPLVKKLGIKSGFRMYGYQLPQDYFHWFDSLPEDLHLLPEEPFEDILAESLDFVHAFVTEKKTLEEILPLVKTKIKKNGMVWVSWPKKASKVVTDLDSHLVRTYGLECGLVDVKVAAVNEVWSAIKLMYRVKDR